jgi:DNA-directed RNA polymerase specialized sigma24 family protein
MTKETPGAKVRAMREAAERGLHIPAQKRIHLLRQLAEIEKELKSRILEASDVGLTHRYIAKIADIPNGTVSRWIREMRE